MVSDCRALLILKQADILYGRKRYMEVAVLLRDWLLEVCDDETKWFAHKTKTALNAIVHKDGPKTVNKWRSATKAQIKAKVTDALSYYEYCLINRGLKM